MELSLNLKTTTSKLFLLSAVFFVFGILFSFQTYAQHEDLFDRTWHLESIVIEDTAIYNPTRFELDIAATIYFNSENNGVIDFDGCPGAYDFLEMEFDETENFFVVSGIGGLPFQYCSDFWNVYEGLQDFTYLYYHDFFLGNEEEVDVSIYYTIYGADNSTQKLVLTNPNGIEAHYNSTHLSTSDFDELSFSISPNPVQNQLNIRLKELSSNLNLEIYDIQGKLLEKHIVSEIEIQLDVAKLSTGIYFIKLTEDSGASQTMRFVKE